MKDLRELSNEELDQLLVEKISGLPREKRANLLEWAKKEFPELADREG